jgi:hypothetical protein
MEPFVWLVQCPPDITSTVVSDKTPKSTITNSDLEKATVLLYKAVLEGYLGSATQGTKIGTCCNKSPAVAWITCMTSGSPPPITFCLLKGLTLC